MANIAESKPSAIAARVTELQNELDAAQDDCTDDKTCAKIQSVIEQLATVAARIAEIEPLEAANNTDSFSELWYHINQLETILETMNESEFTNEENMRDAATDDRDRMHRGHRDRMYGLLGAARTIADVLARRTRVRA
jgi:hypothetical protein